MTNSFTSMIFFISVLMFTAAANAQETVSNHFASCTGDVNSVQFTLDFFEEFDSGSYEPTGKGHFVQTMESKTGASMKMIGKTDVENKADGRLKTVSMYAILDPSVLFATFDINLESESEVEIFAKGFGAVWGTFICSPKLAL